MKTQLFFRACLLIASGLFFATTGQAQPWTFTGPGDWDDASKWSPSYPGLNIGFSSVTINGDCNLENNTVNYSSGGALEINGNLTATGGTIVFTQGVLVNNGTIVHDGASGLTFSMPGSGIVNNAGTGTLTFNADFFCGGAINNAGQMTINATVSNATLDNSGTTTGNGTLSLGGNSNNSGTRRAGDRKTVQFLVHQQRDAAPLPQFHLQQRQFQPKRRCADRSSRR